MILFYQSFIKSVLSFCMVAWYGGLPLTSKGRLSRLVNVAAKVVGVHLTQQNTF